MCEQLLRQNVCKVHCCFEIRLNPLTYKRTENKLGGKDVFLAASCEDVWGSDGKDRRILNFYNIRRSLARQLITVSQAQNHRQAIIWKWVTNYVLHLKVQKSGSRWNSYIFIWFDKNRQAQAISNDTPRMRFVDACLAVRAGDRTGVKHLEEPSPKLDTTHLMAPMALWYSRNERGLCMYYTHKTHELLFYEYV
jgi:hypothetical protein